MFAKVAIEHRATGPYYREAPEFFAPVEHDHSGQLLGFPRVVGFDAELNG